MKVIELLEQAKLTIYAGNGLDNEIIGGYVSDLLSDVMGHAREGQLWITLQNHINVLAICSLKDLAGVVLVKGIIPSDELIAKALEENIPLLGSSLPTFETAGALFNLLKT